MLILEQANRQIYYIRLFRLEGLRRQAPFPEAVPGLNATPFLLKKAGLYNSSKTNLPMCGVVCVISKNGIDRQAFGQMCNALAHRGPDATRSFFLPDDNIALGHTRLSIIDLSATANQPFHTEDGRYTIIYNGEVYNHRELRNELEVKYQAMFRTTSDTEVIVKAFALWGVKVIERLRGMFVIVILDKASRKVFIFRDRLGKKPLFYFVSSETVAFASEMKSLLAHPRIRNSVEVNRSVATTFLHLGYIPSPQTIYKNVFKFPAGHYGEIDDRLSLDLTSYWDIRTRIPKEQIHAPDTAIANLHDLLRQAVKERLVSDVPLGAFLSGGTDSSLVAAIASEQMESRLKTFSIGFTESKFDESKYARDVSNRLKTEHTAYTLSEKEASSILDNYLRHFDEPFADTSAIPTMLVSSLARKEVKVALTGDGGDELFQGYGAYQWANRLDSPWIKRLRMPIRLLLNATGRSRLQRVGHLFESETTGSLRSHIFSQEQYLFSQQEIRHEVLRDEFNASTFDYDESFLAGKNLSAGEKQALFDLQFYLRDDLLHKVDYASMYHSLECRSPLLDHRVVELAFSLHNSLKRRKGITKWILKKILAGYLPQELIDRPKWGFSIPLSHWLRNELRYLISDYLDEKTVEVAGVARYSYVQRLVAGFFDGKDYLYNRIWVLIVLHKWLKEH